MKNTQTILNRYLSLANARKQAHESQLIASIEKADTAFWAFVEKYMYSLDINQIRQFELSNGVEDEWAAFS